MRYLSIVLFTLLLFAVSCSDDDPETPTGPPDPGAPDNGWVTLYPQPQPNTLNAVCAPSLNVAVAVGQAGAVVRTTDGGVNWESVRGECNLEALNDIDIVGDFGLAGGGGGELLRTGDGGATWSPLDLDGYGGTIHGIDVVDASVAVVVGTNGLIRLTADGGDSWVTRDSGAGTFLDVSFHTPDEGMVVGMNAAALWTETGGAIWHTRSLPDVGMDVRAVEMTAASTGIVGGIIIEDEPPWPSEGLVFRTVDGGESWVERWSGRHLGIDDLSMATSTTGYALMGSNVIETSDGGETWSESRQVPTTLFGLASASETEVVGVGNYGALCRTLDSGETWSSEMTTMHPNVPHGDCNSVWFTDSRTGFLGVGSEGLYKTIDGGETWEPSGIAHSISNLYFLDEFTGMAISNLSGIDMMRTTDGGETWATTPGVEEGLFIHFAADGVGLATGSGGYIRRSTDSGQTWGAPVTAPADYQLYDPYCISADTVLVIGQITTIFRSTDGGVSSWDAISTPYNAVALAFSEDGLTGIATCHAGDGSGAIIRTQDAGATWTVITSTSWPPRRLVYVGDQTYYAAGDSGGVIKSVDGGLSWVAQSTPTDNPVRDISFIGPDIGFMVGSGGMILKTETGGD